MEASMSDPVLRGTQLNGAVIPARSDNDTGNNPHNPMKGIARAGADGSILTLAGSENSPSGGNSTEPVMLMSPDLQPTKVDRPSDVTALVDTGQLVGILGPDDATRGNRNNTAVPQQGAMDWNQQVTSDEVVRDLVSCGYLKSADIADRFGGTPLDPGLDPMIVGPNGIFTDAEFNGGGRDGSEFRKTAAIMKVLRPSKWAATTTMVARARRVRSRISVPDVAWAPASSTQVASVCP
jgi:hypothetical protein